MSLRRIFAIFRNDVSILRQDYSPLVVLIVMPLAIIAFAAPLYQHLLVDGQAGRQVSGQATGAELAIPGLAVMFAFFLVNAVGFSFFREFGWGTWDRLRVSPARSWEIVAGKMMAPLCLAIIQQTALFGLGGLLFSLRIQGSVLALIPVAFAVSLCALSLGIAAVAVCRTVQQISSFSYVSMIVLGGLGGALTPVALLPSWVQWLAPAAPSFWAIHAYRTVILEGGGLADVASDTLMLLGLSSILLVGAGFRFHLDERKRGWA